MKEHYCKTSADHEGKINLIPGNQELEPESRIRAEDWGRGEGLGQGRRIGEAEGIKRRFNLQFNHDPKMVQVIYGDP